MISQNPASFRIGNKVIGGGNPPFIIAEAGINHNGDLQTAKEMVLVAKDAGADAIKFQTFKAEEFCLDPNQLFTYQSQGKSITEPMVQMFKRYEFKIEEWTRLEEHCKKHEIMFLSTPQNLSDMEMLLRLEVPALKVGSDDLTNLPLIEAYSKKNLPLILSSGMSSLDEIYSALESANWFSGSPIVVMICTSLYPTPLSEAGIGRVKTLREAFPGLIVGFSDHTESSQSAVIARALGANVFEKHFTLDKGMEGPDHWFSPDPQELKVWVDDIRAVDTILGDFQIRMRAAEASNKREFQRVIVAKRDIKAGEMFDEENLTMGRVSGGLGLAPKWIDSVKGKIATSNYSKGDAIEF